MEDARCGIILLILMVLSDSCTTASLIGGALSSITVPCALCEGRFLGLAAILLTLSCFCSALPGATASDGRAIAWLNSY